MWYKSNRKISYSLPIFAYGKNSQFIFMLIPITEEGTIVGYRWFSLNDGLFVSKLFKDVEDALASQENVFNFDVYKTILEKIKNVDKDIKWG